MQRITLPRINEETNEILMEVLQSTDKVERNVSVTNSLVQSFESLFNVASTMTLDSLSEIALIMTDIGDALKDGIKVQKAKIKDDKIKRNEEEVDDIEEERENRPTPTRKSWTERISSLDDIIGGMSKGIPTALAAFYGALLNPALIMKNLGGILGLGALIAPKLMGIVGSIGLAIVEGFEGMLNSETFGASKISSFIAGFFAGDGNRTLFSYIKNMGKWAIMGATAGSFIPVVGTVIGALIGAAIGGLATFLGADFISNKIDQIAMSVGRKLDMILGTDFVFDQEKINARKKSAQDLITKTIEDISITNAELNDLDIQLKEAIVNGNTTIIEDLKQRKSLLEFSKQDLDTKLLQEREKLAKSLEDEKTAGLSYFERYKEFGFNLFFNNDTLKSLADNLAPYIISVENFKKDMMDSFSNQVSNLNDYRKIFIDKHKDFASELSNRIIGYVESAKEGFFGAGNYLIEKKNNIVNGFFSIGSNIADFFIEMKNDIYNSFIEGTTAIKDSLVDVWNDIVDTVRNSFENMKNTVKDAFTFGSVKEFLFGKENNGKNLTGRQSDNIEIYREELKPKTRELRHRTNEMPSNTDLLRELSVMNNRLTTNNFNTNNNVSTVMPRTTTENRGIKFNR